MAWSNRSSWSRRAIIISWWMVTTGSWRAKQMGVKQFSAVRPGARPGRGAGHGEDRPRSMGLRTLDDVKIIDGSHHPLVEITTRLLKDEGSSIRANT